MAADAINQAPAEKKLGEASYLIPKQILSCLLRPKPTKNARMPNHEKDNFFGKTTFLLFGFWGLNIF